MLEVVVDTRKRANREEMRQLVRKYLQELDAAVAETRHMQLLKPMVRLNQSVDRLLEVVG